MEELKKTRKTTCMVTVGQLALPENFLNILGVD